MKGTATVHEERWFNWTSSRQTRDELKAAANKLIWSSVINSSVPILMNRIPVAFPQSQTERSCSHTVILSHVLCVSLSMSAIPILPTFPVTSLSFIFISLWFPRSLSFSLFIFITILLFLPIVSYNFSQFFPLLSLPLYTGRVFQEAQQMTHTRAACWRHPTCFTDSSCGGKGTKKRKKRRIELEAIRFCDDFLKYIDTKKVYMYEKVRGSKNSLFLMY